MRTEADRVAESVMRMPEGSQVLPRDSDASLLVRRKCACGGRHEERQCEECKKLRENSVQRSAEPSAPVGLAPPIVHEVLRSPGQSLDSSTGTFFGNRSKDTKA